MSLTFFASNPISLLQSHQNLCWKGRMRQLMNERKHTRLGVRGVEFRSCSAAKLGDLKQINMPLQAGFSVYKISILTKKKKIKKMSFSSKQLMIFSGSAYLCFVLVLCYHGLCVVVFWRKVLSSNSICMQYWLIQYIAQHLSFFIPCKNSHQLFILCLLTANPTPGTGIGTGIQALGNPMFSRHSY